MGCTVMLLCEGLLCRWTRVGECGVGNCCGGRVYVRNVMERDG